MSSHVAFKVESKGLNCPPLRFPMASLSVCRLVSHFVSHFAVPFHHTKYSLLPQVQYPLRLVMKVWWYQILLYLHVLPGIGHLRVIASLDVVASGSSPCLNADCTPGSYKKIKQKHRLAFFLFLCFSPTFLLTSRFLSGSLRLPHPSSLIVPRRAAYCCKL